MHSLSQGCTLDRLVVAELEKLEPAKPKPIWRKLISGCLLLVVADDFGDLTGMMVLRVILFIVGFWLLLAGAKPLRAKKPSE